MSGKPNLAAAGSSSAMETPGTSQQQDARNQDSKLKENVLSKLSSQFKTYCSKLTPKKLHAAGGLKDTAEQELANVKAMETQEEDQVSQEQDEKAQNRLKSLLKTRDIYIREQEEEIVVLLDENEILSSQLVELKNLHKSQETEMKELKMTVVEADDERAELRDHLAWMKSTKLEQFEKLTSELDDAKALNDKYRSENSRLKAELFDSNENETMTGSRFLAETHEHERLREKLQADIDQLSERLRLVQDRKKTLHEQNESLIPHILQLEEMKKSYEGRVKETEDKAVQTSQEEDEQVQTSEEEDEDVQTSEEEDEDVPTSKEEDVKEETPLKLLLKVRDIYIKEQEEELIGLLDENEILSSQVAELKKLTKSLEAEMKQLKMTLVEADDEIAELKDHLAWMKSTKREQFEKLTSELDDVKALNDKYQSENSQLKSELSDPKGNETSSRIRFVAETHQQERLREKLQADIDQLSEKLQLAQDSEKTLHEQNESLNAYIVQLEEINASYEGSIKETEDKAVQTSQEQDEVVQTSEEDDEKVQTRLRENQTAEDLHRRKQEEVEILSSQLAELKNLNESQEAEIKHLKRTLVEVEDERAEVKDHLAWMTALKLEPLGKLTSELDDAKALSDKYQSENSRLKAELCGLKENETGLQQDIDQLSERLRLAGDSERTLHERNESLIAYIVQLEDMNTSYEGTIKELKAAVQNVERHENAAEQDHSAVATRERNVIRDTLTSELADQKTRIRALKTTVRDLSENVDFLMDQDVSLTNRLKRLECRARKRPQKNKDPQYLDFQREEAFTADLRRTVRDPQDQLEIGDEESQSLCEGGSTEDDVAEAEDLEAPDDEAFESPAAEAPTRSLWRRCAKGLLYAGIATMGALVPIGMLAVGAYHSDCLSGCAYQMLGSFCDFSQRPF